MEVTSELHTALCFVCVFVRGDDTHTPPHIDTRRGGLTVHPLERIQLGHLCQECDPAMTLFDGLFLSQLKK